MRLTREAELAAAWDMALEQIRVLRRRHGWAHVRLSRQDIRYTDEQIARIVHDLTIPERPRPANPGGLTERSLRYHSEH